MHDFLFRTHDPVPAPEPREPDELDQIADIPDRIEQTIAFARFFGRRNGWSEVAVFNDAMSRIDTHWFRWERQHKNHGVAWMGYRRDFHQLRQHFLHLPDFRRPSEEAIPYPQGSFEPTLRAWFERELKWTREWRSAEFEIAIYEAGGGRVH
jgi:hypothetical protein